MQEQNDLFETNSQKEKANEFEDIRFKNILIYLKKKPIEYQKEFAKRLLKEVEHREKEKMKFKEMVTKIYTSMKQNNVSIEEFNKTIKKLQKDNE